MQLLGFIRSDRSILVIIQTRFAMMLGRVKYNLDNLRYSSQIVP